MGIRYFSVVDFPDASNRSRVVAHGDQALTGDRPHSAIHHIDIQHSDFIELVESVDFIHFGRTSEKVSEYFTIQGCLII